MVFAAVHVRAWQLQIKWRKVGGKIQTKMGSTLQAELTGAC